MIFQNTAFNLLSDTNSVFLTNATLYGVITNFPSCSNPGPNLQLAVYGTNSVLIEANHFDYSSDSRDFGLIVCDNLALPVWKNIDLLGSSDAQDGWVLAGTVPNWQVTDPMYFLVQNLPAGDNAFFAAVPYGGAHVTLSGPSPDSTVSGVVTLTASIQDLGGTSNEIFSMNVDGAPARYTIGAGNMISFDTAYNINGGNNIYATVVCANAVVYNPTNVPDNANLVYTGQGILPLDFENHMFLAAQSDYCPDDAGTNNILVYIDNPQTINWTISDPANDTIVASYGGYVPQAGYVDIAWNMTEADGVTPYSNNIYVVQFTAYDPGSLAFTNNIDRSRLRFPQSCLLSYEWEDPNTSDGLTLNTRAAIAIDGNLMTLLQSLYLWYGLTQYTPFQVGALSYYQRNQPGLCPYEGSSSIWKIGLLAQLTNSGISELTIAQAHGNSVVIGGGHYLPDEFDNFALSLAVVGVDSPNWRLRRAALWSCYSGADSATAGLYQNWAQACGIKDRWLQYNSVMYKNTGLFFGGKLQQFLGPNTATADAAAFLDQAWVCGMYQYPGGCDPNWSYNWCIRATVGNYPSLANALPLVGGFDMCVYNAGQDERLRVGDVSQVHNN